MNARPDPFTIIAALREEIEELRETVRQLRNESEPDAEFPRVWGLTLSQERVLAMLLAASPRIVTYDLLIRRLYEDREPDCAMGCLKAFVLGTRNKLFRLGMGDAIKTRRGLGYWIGEADRYWFLAAVAEADRHDTVGGARV